MRYHVILSPDAEADIESAIRWYADKHLELPFRFTTETTRTLRRVGQNPYQFPAVSSLVRRALMKRFPYAIDFTVNPKTVFVLTVLHQRRLNPWSKP